MVREKAFLREGDGKSQNWLCQNLSCLTLNPEKAEVHLWGRQLQCPHQLSVKCHWDTQHIDGEMGWDPPAGTLWGLLSCVCRAAGWDLSICPWMRDGRAEHLLSWRELQPWPPLESALQRERERTLGSQLSFHLQSKCWQSPKTFLKWPTLVSCRMKIPLALNRLLTWKIKVSECQSLSGMGLIWKMPFRFSLPFL